MSIKILNPGVRSLIQDGGRFGLARYGVPRSGAFDRMSWRLANELVGNNVPDEYATDAGPASIEVLLGGLRIEATRDLVVAVTGADVPVTCLDVDADDKREAAMNERITLTAGSRLHIGSPKVGLHTYVAVSGGIAVDYVLGSRSTDTTSTIGPHPLEKGRILPVGDARPSSPVMDQTELLELPTMTSTATVAVRPGPDVGLLSGGIDDLTGTRTWTVSPVSSRSGIRLTRNENDSSGSVDRNVRARLSSRESVPTTVGTVQALPDGELVIVGPDGPTTGGYPVVAVLDWQHVSIVAQARPGSILRFEETTR